MGLVIWRGQEKDPAHQKKDRDQSQQPDGPGQPGGGTEGLVLVHLHHEGQPQVLDPAIGPDNRDAAVVSVKPGALFVADGRLDSRGVDPPQEILPAEPGGGDENVVPVHQVGLSGPAQTGSFQDDPVHPLQVQVGRQDPQLHPLRIDQGGGDGHDRLHGGRRRMNLLDERGKPPVFKGPVADPVLALHVVIGGQDDLPALGRHHEDFAQVRLVVDAQFQELAQLGVDSGIGRALVLRLQQLPGVVLEIRQGGDEDDLLALVQDPVPDLLGLVLGRALQPLGDGIRDVFPGQTVGRIGDQDHRGQRQQQKIDDQLGHHAGGPEGHLRACAPFSRVARRRVRPAAGPGPGTPSPKKRNKFRARIMIAGAPETGRIFGQGMKDLRNPGLPSLTSMMATLLIGSPVPSKLSDPARPG